LKSKTQTTFFLMKTVQYIYKCDNGTNFYWAVKPKELVKIKIFGRILFFLTRLTSVNEFF